MKYSILCLAVLGAVGCSSGEAATTGVDEPIQIANASFHEGPLPGSKPLPDETADAGPPARTPNVTGVLSANLLVQPGQVGKNFQGGATDDAVAIGVRFADIGTGYWVVPAGAPDPTKPGEVTWSMSAAIGRYVPPGNHPLRFAAIDDSGHAGSQFSLPVCIDSAVPDNFNACDPTSEPPAVVVSLDWDTNSDLDLTVITPDGTIVDPKHPTTATPDADGGVVVDPTKDGVFDRDSNANCVIDGQRREDLVWQGKPAPGTYYVFVNMFAACGQLASRFNVTLDMPAKHGADYTVEQKLRRSGELLASDANGGTGAPLYVMQFGID